MDNFYPVLETERLELSAILPSDIPTITAYANNAKIAEMTLTMPHPYKESDAEFWLKLAIDGARNDKHYIFAIRDKTTKAFLGGIDLMIERKHDRAELAYWLAEPFWMQGYMTEAASRMMQYAFEECGIQKVFAACFDFNIGSSSVMQKIGLKYEGMMKDHVKKGEKYCTIVQYGLTKNEYLINSKL